MNSSTLARWYREAPVTVILVAVNCAFYLITAIESRSLQHNLEGSSLGEALVFFPPHAAYMGFTGVFPAVGHAFLHVGFAHLLMNMFLLFLIGREIESYVGSRLMLAAYMCSVVGTAACLTWAAPLDSTAGASGAVYALMVIFIVLCHRTGRDVRGPAVLLAVNVVYTFIAVNVSLWGHIGGIIMGCLLAWPLVYGSARQRTPIVGLVLGASLCALLVGFAKISTSIL
ncbi:Rhomboid family protein [Corynebacterium ciconiae DSM 44920]|uniref:rhomboid family intramembrane serine protease n=1 Tax=Corynebacterium ciconiae TaxID=227319 RepID=UPI00035D7804|nr:rhomboid family intramembrane serine protease [Corynebacterium ciconiae]WKD60082.1 Rhomboid family protein [Corynebacterium ciconiae DSM 44920]